MSHTRLYSVTWPTVVLVCGASVASALLTLGLALRDSLWTPVVLIPAALIAIGTVLWHAAQDRQPWREPAGEGLVRTHGPCSSCGRDFDLADLRGWVGGDYCESCFATVAPTYHHHDSEVA